jgi:hypothetical protein
MDNRSVAGERDAADQDQDGNDGGGDDAPDLGPAPGGFLPSIASASALEGLVSPPQPVGAGPGPEAAAGPLLGPPLMPPTAAAVPDAPAGTTISAAPFSSLAVPGQVRWRAWIPRRRACLSVLTAERLQAPMSDLPDEDVPILSAVCAPGAPAKGPPSALPAVRSVDESRASR